MATTSSDVAQGLMAEIARIAPTKAHHLSADMVNGSRQLTEASARMVLEHLGKCPDKPGTARHCTSQPKEVPAMAREPLPRLEAFKDIPKGYYATPSATGANDLDFWRVSKGRQGTQWEGFSFAARVLGGGDGKNMRTVSLSNIQQRLALLAIQAAGPEEAGMMFAANVRRCRDCGLVLTDEESRAAGRGPDCRGKKGK